MTQNRISHAATALASASRVLVLTGAGISAESGIPTFRGQGGLWEGFRAEDLATPEAFAADPERVWRWYRWRRDSCQAARPNPAHETLVEMESAVEEFLLATQNVDGLHRRAGSRKILELHGNIDQARCTSCEIVVALTDTQAPEGSVVPICVRCSSRMRPHILWFGEVYWPGVLETAFRAAERADIVIVVGTSARVWPPAQIALLARRSGAVLVDINTETTELSEAADFSLQGPAATILPEMWQMRSR